MKKLVLPLLVAGFASVLFAGCELVGGDDTERFQIGVNQLDVPDQISAQEELSIGVSFIAQRSIGCNRLESIDVDRNDGQAIIKITGEHVGGVCLDVIIQGDTTLTLPPPYEQNPFTIIANQSIEGEQMTKEVQVSE